MSTVRCKFRRSVRSKRASKKTVRPPRSPSRAARMLALARHIERQIDAGAIPDYAAAARTLGVTRARLTQVMNLLLLAPQIQERIAMGDLILTERTLRRVVGEADWDEQRALAATSWLTASPPPSPAEVGSKVGHPLDNLGTRTRFPRLEI